MCSDTDAQWKNITGIKQLPDIYITTVGQDNR